VNDESVVTLPVRAAELADTKDVGEQRDASDSP
jgi:hypothetical protein